MQAETPVENESSRIFGYIFRERNIPNTVEKDPDCTYYYFDLSGVLETNEVDKHRNTVGKNIIDISSFSATNYESSICLLIAAVSGAIIWNLITWWFGLPSISSRALVGGMIGAVLIAHGADKIMLKGVMFALASLILSPFLGLIFGAIVLRATLYFSRNASPEIKKTFSRLQIVSSLALALSHGANDAQKSMGVITMAFRAGFGLRRNLPSYPAWPPLMRFLFVGPALCLRLPSDPTSRWAPLPSG